jgi:hypothetical protein
MHDSGWDYSMDEQPEGFPEDDPIQGEEASHEADGVESSDEQPTDALEEPLHDEGIGPPDEEHTGDPLDASSTEGAQEAPGHGAASPELRFPGDEPPAGDEREQPEAVPATLWREDEELENWLAQPGEAREAARTEPAAAPSVDEADPDPDETAFEEWLGESLRSAPDAAAAPSVDDIVAKAVDRALRADQPPESG